MSTASIASTGGRRAPSRVPAGLALRLLPLVVVALVVGILGMHAISTSHTMAGGHGGGAVEHAATVGAATGQAHGADRPVSDQAAAADGTTAARNDAGHGAGSMMMLCAAMLLSAGALLLALFVWRRTQPVWARLVARSEHHLVHLAPSTVRGGPPPVWEFSVIRC